MICTFFIIFSLSLSAVKYNPHHVLKAYVQRHQASKIKCSHVMCWCWVLFTVGGHPQINGSKTCDPSQACVNRSGATSCRLEPQSIWVWLEAGHKSHKSSESRNRGAPPHLDPNQSARHGSDVVTDNIMRHKLAALNSDLMSPK